MNSTGARIAVVGAGPAGLMAAETLAAAGLAVDVYDAMPSAGRKFLLAGKGGLNLTHSEDAEAFVSRYGARSSSGPAPPWRPWRPVWRGSAGTRSLPRSRRGRSEEPSSCCDTQPG